MYISVEKENGNCYSILGIYRGNGKWELNRDSE